MRMSTKRSRYNTRRTKKIMYLTIKERCQKILKSYFQCNLHAAEYIYVIFHKVHLYRRQNNFSWFAKNSPTPSLRH